MKKYHLFIRDKKDNTTYHTHSIYWRRCCDKWVCRCIISENIKSKLSKEFSSEYDAVFTIGDIFLYIKSNKLQFIKKRDIKNAVDIVFHNPTFNAAHISTLK